MDYSIIRKKNIRFSIRTCLEKYINVINLYSDLTLGALRRQNGAMLYLDYFYTRVDDIFKK